MERWIPSPGLKNAGRSFAGMETRAIHGKNSIHRHHRFVIPAGSWRGSSGLQSHKKTLDSRQKRAGMTFLRRYRRMITSCPSPESTTCAMGRGRRTWIGPCAFIHGPEKLA
jgi:hypothetical protein